MSARKRAARALVSCRIATPGANPWLSSFDAIAVDHRGNRVPMFNRTGTPGMYLYEVPVDRFTTGGLKLADLKPTLTGSCITRNVAIVP